jgi:hypothetical protein
MSMATTVVMLATVGVVAGQTLYVVLNTLDVFPVIPSALGHPPVDADLNEFVIYDYEPIKWTLQSTNSVEEVNGVEIIGEIQAEQGHYIVSRGEGRNDMVSHITVIEFSGVSEAREFIDAWYPCQPYSWECDHTIDLDMEDTLLFEGRFLRIYDNDTALAHNAWQTVNWVTIIETEGTFIDAMPLNKEIREMIEARYRGIVENESGVLPIATQHYILVEPTAIP